jgi:hypothetical protein
MYVYFQISLPILMKKTYKVIDFYLRDLTKTY